MSIKQAIEALESCDPGDYSTGHVIHPSYDEEKVKAALAALRSMPQGEPVAWQWRKKDQPWSLERTFNSQVFATTDDSEVRPLFATPHTEAVRMSEAEINHLVDTHVGGPTPSYPLGPEDWINFARAVEQATAARLGVKMGDARHADQA